MFFLAIFKKKFLGKQYLEARKQEFISLKQSELSVVKFEVEERNHYQRFLFGLHHVIQLYLVTHDTANSDKLVDKAKAIENIKAQWAEKQVSRRG